MTKQNQRLTIKDCSPLRLVSGWERRISVGGIFLETDSPNFLNNLFDFFTLPIYIAGHGQFTGIYYTVKNKNKKPSRTYVLGEDRKCDPPDSLHYVEENVTGEG